MTKRNKNKKKDVDFQKVKLKVGRRLKKDSKDTRAEFKAKKIVIKEAKFFKTDPLSMLLKHGDHISQHSKLNLLNQLSSVINSDIIKSLNKPFVDSLAKFIIDQSEQVRSAANRCIKTCMNQMRQQHVPLNDFVGSLKPYIDCAYTHISIDIVQSCRRLLDSLISYNDPQLHPILMAIFTRRMMAGNLEPLDIHLANQVKNCRLKCLARKEKELELSRDKVVPFRWTKLNFYLDLDELSMNCSANSEEELILGLQKDDNQDVEKKFYSLLNRQNQIK